MHVFDPRSVNVVPKFLVWSSESSFIILAHSGSDLSDKESAEAVSCPELDDAKPGNALTSNSQANCSKILKFARRCAKIPQHNSELNESEKKEEEKEEKMDCSQSVPETVENENKETPDSTSSLTKEERQDTFELVSSSSEVTSSAQECVIWPLSLYKNTKYSAGDEKPLLVFEPETFEIATLDASKHSKCLKRTKHRNECAILHHKNKYANNGCWMSFACSTLGLAVVCFNPGCPSRLSFFLN